STRGRAKEEIRNVSLVLDKRQCPGSKMPGGPRNRREDPRALRSRLHGWPGTKGCRGRRVFHRRGRRTCPGGVLVLDELLESLGPYTVEAAVLTGEYEPCELVIAPTAEAGVTALSRHRLNQIKPLLNDLTTEGRESLATLLREANG